MPAVSAPRRSPAGASARPQPGASRVQAAHGSSSCSGSCYRTDPECRRCPPPCGAAHRKTKTKCQHSIHREARRCASRALRRPRAGPRLPRPLHPPHRRQRPAPVQPRGWLRASATRTRRAWILRWPPDMHSHPKSAGDHTSRTRSPCRETECFRQMSFTWREITAGDRSTTHRSGDTRSRKRGRATSGGANDPSWTPRPKPGSSRGGSDWRPSVSGTGEGDRRSNRTHCSTCRASCA